MGRTGRALAVAAVVLAATVVGSRYWLRKNVSRVQRGWVVANDMGCFACHGPGGIRGMANPGYGLDEVPPFSGGMITMYVQDEGEIREWILDGRTRRFQANPFARFFLDRQSVPMPAYRGHVTPAALETLVDYIHWVRQHPY